MTGPISDRIAGETLAIEHLERLGYEILDAPCENAHGRLAAVALDCNDLVFVDVLTRGAGETVHASPDRRLFVRKIAARWLAEHARHSTPPLLRFDVIVVTVDDRDRLAALEHLEAVL